MVMCNFPRKKLSGTIKRLRDRSVFQKNQSDITFSARIRSSAKIGQKENLISPEALKNKDPKRSALGSQRAEARPKRNTASV